MVRTKLLCVGMPPPTTCSSPTGSTSTLRSQSETEAPVTFAEPDVIASTKPSVVTHTSSTDVGPVAPPRRKKKSKPQEPPSKLPVVPDSLNIPLKVWA